MRAAIVVMISLLLAACSERQAPAEPVRGLGTLAARLLADGGSDWSSVEIPGVHLHLRRGSAAETDRREIAESVSAVRHELLAMLGVSESPEVDPPAHLFFVNSRDDTARLTGRPLAGFVQPDEPTGVFIYMPGYRLTSLLRHELTHLYTFQRWGTPRAGAWLVEGVAVWAAGGCQDHSPDALAAGAHARGALVPLRQLATGFRELGEDVAMPAAGSIVAFLVRRSGLAEVQRYWQRETSPNEHPLGPDGAQVEQAWRDHIARIPPATIDVARVLKEGC